MDKSKRIWEEFPISPHSISDKFRDFYRHLLPTGLLDMELNEKSDLSNPKIILNQNANPELIGVIEKFCESHAQILHEVSTGIPATDMQRFVVEMAHRFRIIEMNEHSDCVGDLTNIGNLVTRGSISVIRKAALSYIAFYYFDYIQKVKQNKVVNMEEFRDRKQKVLEG